MSAVDSSNRLNLPPEVAAITSIEDIHLDEWDLEGTDYLSKPNDGDSEQTHVDNFNEETGLFEISPPLIPKYISLAQPMEEFDVRQKWEGYVLEVSEETFVARLVPIIGEGPDLEASIDREEVDIEDQTLVEPGAVFYWSIGYLRKPSGTHRDSFIRFRRLPPLTDQEIEEARAKIGELENLFDGS